MRFGGGEGSEGGEESGGLGLHECAACMQDFGDTATLFSHLNSLVGNCLGIMGVTMDEFKKEFTKKRRRKKDLENEEERRRKRRQRTQQVSGSIKIRYQNYSQDSFLGGGGHSGPN